MRTLSGNRKMEANEIKDLIINNLMLQGFLLKDGKILPPENLEKRNIRSLHQMAVKHKIERGKKELRRKEPHFLKRIASGKEVVPEQVSPRLVEVLPNSEEELLFRYISLHWSIPVSSGYGRRLRFLVIDEQNEKLIGIIGLGDPVFSLAARDWWVGWDRETRRYRLKYVMDAFVLGAVPPYTFLLGGKLVAMLAASNEVRAAFGRKYGGSKSVISGEKFDGRLAMLTTASALGRSSIYNRLKYHGRYLYKSVGFTRGSGEFHFFNGLYNDIFAYVTQHSTPTAKQESWGNGFRNRREVIRKCLQSLGLSADWLYHGVAREIFVVPLAENTREFLCGKDPDLFPYDQSARELAGYFRQRWLMPRAELDRRYREFNVSSYCLWGRGEPNDE